MINSTLYLREMKKSVKMLLIFAAVISMYAVIIIGMYDPEMIETLKAFEQMPLIQYLKERLHESSVFSECNGMV